MRDLSDNEIQEWLDQNYTAGGPHPDLSRFSPATRRRIRQYLALFDELRQEPPAGLSPDFTLGVMARISEEPSRDGMAWWQILLSVLGGAFTLGLAVWFMRGVPLAPFRDGLAAALSSVSELASLLAQVGLDPHLLVIGLLTLALAALFDHFVLRARGRVHFLLL